MKISDKTKKYFWEFIRRNEEYVKDWKNYFKDYNFDELKRLLLKWGITSFPESENFGLRWEDVPREIEGGWSDFYIKNEKDYFSALEETFPEVIKNFTLPTLSHNILAGDDPKMARITADWDEKDEIFFHTNEEGKQQRVFYFFDYNNKKINQLTKENIPDEITLTIRNFKVFCREGQSARKACQESAVKKIRDQLSKWGDAAEELGIADKDTRFGNSSRLDDILDVWDRSVRGESEDKIAKEKFLEKGTFRKPSKNRSKKDELGDIYDEMIVKFMKDGLNRSQAEEEADNEIRKMENKHDSDERKTIAAIAKVKKYHKRAEGFVDNPQTFLGDKRTV
jgi:hypothetical protein